MQRIFSSQATPPASDTDNGEEGGVPGGLSPKSRVDVGEEGGVGVPAGLLQKSCIFSFTVHEERDKNKTKKRQAYRLCDVY